ncbi:hypothetical protein ES703_118393 [subsurface metagenome]
MGWQCPYPHVEKHRSAYSGYQNIGSYSGNPYAENDAYEHC